MDLKEQREKAWTGDAVLALFARLWILEQHGHMDGDMQTRMTSNQFLSCFGNPTAIEAEIGLTYEREGLEAAFQLIRERFLPLFEQQEKNRRSGSSTSKAGKRKP